MCGRYVSASSPQDIIDYFGATSVAETLLVDSATTAMEPNFNVAPTTNVATIREREGERHLDLCRWGLVPSWAKSIKVGARMINARSETVATKNSFRAAAKRRRCIIPADAFYEWTAVANPNAKKPVKQPWCIQRVDGDPFAFAGLYEVWRDPDFDDPDDSGAKLFSCTVLTTTANDAMAPIHDRMPVMLAPHRWDAWIDRANEDITSLLDQIEPCPSELLQIHAVSTAVNNSRSRGAELMNEVEPLTPELVARGVDR